jgi:hypothetical protein
MPSSAIEGLLRELVAEVRGLREDLARRAGAGGDRLTGLIVAALWAATEPGEVLTSKSAFAAAQLPHRVALRQALEGLSVNALGIRLADAAEAREVFDGVRVERLNPGKRPARFRLSDVESGKRLTTYRWPT